MTRHAARAARVRLWEGTVRLVEETVPSLLVLLMFVVVIYQIFMRDVLTRPPTWADELARYLYIWMVFLGAALVSRRRAQIRMDFVPRRLPARARTVLLLVHEVAILFFLLYGLWSGLAFFAFYRKIPSPAMEVPSGYLVAAVPVACVLLLIHHLGQAAALIRSLRAR
ncbi:MAG: TRAP transporter small permease [Armatimonadota bacterium]|nr:TRAP transporter small permease [Armatimonadota bacterium]MDR7519287.1 TRAP transporter small permease [Armatimonadota bacterium]MDR7551200.1 TRAP transporter small permease [Armatimonadota bacterium]